MNLFKKKPKLLIIVDYKPEVLPHKAAKHYDTKIGVQPKNQACVSPLYADQSYRFHIYDKVSGTFVTPEFIANNPELYDSECHLAGNFTAMDVEALSKITSKITLLYDL